jgi:hypothetical protein
MREEEIWCVALGTGSTGASFQRVNLKVSKIGVYILTGDEWNLSRHVGNHPSCMIRIQVFPNSL